MQENIYFEGKFQKSSTSEGAHPPLDSLLRHTRATTSGPYVLNWGPKKGGGVALFQISP